MKKLFVVCAALVCLFSCQKNEGISVNGSETEKAVFSVMLPQSVQTRAYYSDGTKATELYYAVYNKAQGTATYGQYLPSIDYGTQPQTINIETTVEIDLVKNVSYDIVFWAQAPKAPYKIDWAGKTISVADEYTNFANDESRDAFYQVVSGYTVKDTPETVELRRPFAQINFGASDYDPVASIIAPELMTSTITLSEVPSAFDVLTGEVTASVKGKTFTKSVVPVALGETLEVNNVSYDWVSMNYVLAPAKKDVFVDVTGDFFYNGKKITVSVPNVPYERNYKTNIIGNFFTGEAQFKVIIIDKFHDEYVKPYPDNNVKP